MTVTAGTFSPTSLVIHVSVNANVTVQNDSVEMVYACMVETYASMLATKMYRNPRFES